jgi:peroxiredoxin
LENKKSKKNRLLVLVAGLWVGACLGAVLLFVLSKLGIISFEGFGKLPLFLNTTNAAGVNEPAPDFMLEDTTGQEVRLSDFLGRAVVLNYWATWCGPCIREMPMFQKYYELYPSDMVVIGIDLQETDEEVKSFLGNMDLTYKILIDHKGDIGKSFQVYALPNTFFIDSDGIIRYHHIGVMTEEQFKVYISQVGVGQ